MKDFKNILKSEILTYDLYKVYKTDWLFSSRNENHFFNLIRCRYFCNRFTVTVTSPLWNYTLFELINLKISSLIICLYLFGFMLVIVDNLQIAMTSSSPFILVCKETVKQAKLLWHSQQHTAMDLLIST
jgi:hypothetical protein